MLTPGMTVAKAARNLGVAESQIYKWRKAVEAHGATAFPGKDNLSPHDDEIRRLKRENEQLRMERDILKKEALASTRHRNCFRQSFGGCHPVQGLPWPAIWGDLSP